MADVIYDKDHPAPFDAHFTSREAWEKRAAFLRRQVLVSQGLFPLPQKTPINPIITDKIDRPDYIIENVSLETCPGFRLSGNLYRPRHGTGPFPIVLHPHGHWPDGRLGLASNEKIDSEIASGAEVNRASASAPLQAFSATLAQMGCIVFHYDMVGYADSQSIPHKEGFDDVAAVLRLQSVMGLQTWNSIRALDYVLSLDNVDPKRVAIAGASGGGTQSIVLTAIDERITCSIPVVMISMNMQGGCVCENSPLLRIDTNNVELAALAAPRFQGGVGAKDWTHDFETRGLPELKHIYQLYSAEDRVEGKVFPYPHNFNLHSRSWCYEFLNRQFHLGVVEPIREKFEPATPDEIRVRLPAQEAAKLLDVVQLRRRWSAQIPELSKEGLREALEAMLALNERELQRLDVHASHVVIPLGKDVHPSVPADTQAVSLSEVRELKVTAHPFLVFGHNRSVLAQQACEAIHLVRSLRASSQVRKITLLAGKDAEALGTIVATIAGSQLDRAIIQKGDFEFDQITDVNDPRVLPGAMKYGGMKAFRELCGLSVRFINEVPTLS
jgi:hypothetical protein